MKSRIILMLMLLVSIVAGAKTDKSNPKYLNGAVPEENGMIVFKKTFSVAQRSTDKIYDAILNYVKNDVMGKAINENRTRIISEDRTGGNLVARVEEYMTFSHKPLNLDRTRFRYQINANVTGNKVNLIVTQISYYYNEDMDGQNGENIKGEEWITDKMAVNKKNTKLYPRSAKFRVKTIDRVEAIFDGAMDALEDREVKADEPAKKIRRGITEE